MAFSNQRFVNFCSSWSVKKIFRLNWLCLLLAGSRSHVLETSQKHHTADRLDILPGSQLPLTTQSERVSTNCSAFTFYSKTLFDVKKWVSRLCATTHLVFLGIKEMSCMTHKFTRGESLSQQRESPPPLPPPPPLGSALTQEGAGKQQQQQAGRKEWRPFYTDRFVQIWAIMSSKGEWDNQNGQCAGPGCSSARHHKKQPSPKLTHTLPMNQGKKSLQGETCNDKEQ